MPAPAFMLSFLKTRRQLDLADFESRYAGWWLVWEPGGWRPSGSMNQTIAFTADPTKRSGDCLSFQLGLGAPEGRALSVGRDPGSDVVLNDGTVSRHHVTLLAERGGFRFEAHKPTMLNHKPASGGLLKTGQTLTLGGALLTVLDDAGLVLRLSQA